MAKKLWGGRFSKKTDPDVEKFTQSINVDYRLARHDIMASMVHTRILLKAKLISPEEASILYKGLKEISDEIKAGRYKIDKNAEDIHTDIQNKLQNRVGEVALKLHTARSRNEQVVFDTKRYCVFEISNITNKLISEFISAIEYLAMENYDVIMPGYTHLQHAQPVRFRQYILAYKYMLKRDSQRLLDALSRLSYPLGSGALAGTSIIAELYAQAAKEIDKEMKHPFFKAVENAIENISDRDFVIEILSALAILGMHLSRLAEDFIIWSASEFGFIEIDDAFCTGSSLMPQKKNPDTVELIRGYAGKLYGNLLSVLVTMKGIPLTYNRDMQLDKEPLFSSVDIVKDELKILAKLIKSIKLNKDNIARQLEDESLYAADLAYYLAEKKVPSRKAHEIVGKMIKDSLARKKNIKEMTNEELKKYSPSLNKKVIAHIFDAGKSVESKKSFNSK